MHSGCFNKLISIVIIHTAKIQQNIQRVKGSNEVLLDSFDSVLWKFWIVIFSSIDEAVLYGYDTPNNQQDG